MPDSRQSPSKVGLDSFRILSVIGKGSFGKVFLVQMKGRNSFYAMKVLRKENIIKRNQVSSSLAIFLRTVDNGACLSSSLQVEHTRTERQVLGYVRHPFVVGLNYAFQTIDKLYFVLDFCAGGELFYHLGQVGKFPEPRAKFYAAEITLALEYIHSLGIIYRDLKPENVLLDHRGEYFPLSPSFLPCRRRLLDSVVANQLLTWFRSGHVRLTDFGLSKEGIQNNFTGAHSFCGTPEYLAPEILNRSGHGRAVDWWSLGEHHGVFTLPLHSPV